MPNSARCGWLQQELAARGITCKRWTSASGRCWGGKPISRGTLYLLLQNRLYRSEITHKEQTYPGEHQAIIDPALWDAVQARLAENPIERGRAIGIKHPSLLAGLLFDAGTTGGMAKMRGCRRGWYSADESSFGTRIWATANMPQGAAFQFTLPRQDS